MSKLMFAILFGSRRSLVVAGVLLLSIGMGGTFLLHPLGYGSEDWMPYVLSVCNGLGLYAFVCAVLPAFAEGEWIVLANGTELEMPATKQWRLGLILRPESLDDA